jgi:hypothetical protein
MNIIDDFTRNKKIENGEIKYDDQNNCVMCENINKYDNIVKILKISDRTYLQQYELKYLLMEYDVSMIDNICKIYNNLTPSIEFFELHYLPTPVNSSPNTIVNYVKIMVASREINIYNLNNKLKNLKISILYANVNLIYLPSSLKKIEINNKEIYKHVSLKIQNLSNKIELLLINNFVLKNKFKPVLKLQFTNIKIV